MDKINETNSRIIKSSLKLIRSCPVCNSKYTPSTARVIENGDDEENGVLVYFSCPRCSSSLLARVVELPFGVVGSAMLTDLEADEVEKFKNSDEVTVDDVLEVYRELELMNKD